jgi:hypothetical protein
LEQTANPSTTSVRPLAAFPAAPSGPFIAVAGGRGRGERCAPWRRAPGPSCTGLLAPRSRSRRHPL